MPTDTYFSDNVTEQRATIVATVSRETRFRLFSNPYTKGWAQYVEDSGYIYVVTSHSNRCCVTQCSGCWQATGKTGRKIPSQSLLGRNRRASRPDLDAKTEELCFAYKWPIRQAMGQQKTANVTYNRLLDRQSTPSETLTILSQLFSYFSAIYIFEIAWNWRIKKTMKSMGRGGPMLPTVIYNAM